MQRAAQIKRKTKETEIELTLSLDGSGQSNISTGIPFMDHMFTLFSAHGFLDLQMKAEGDTEIDDHHTVEDLGICLGMALHQALGDRKGLRRYGEATVPMDEALARVVIDLSNRPYLSYRVVLKKQTAGTFDVGLIEEFFRALVNHARITLHVELMAGSDPHHSAEAVFKAFARALDHAVGREPRLNGEVPSTKGLL
jgi:imidazoleglycerol-phosphate dehydratase